LKLPRAGRYWLQEKRGRSSSRHIAARDAELAGCVPAETNAGSGKIGGSVRGPAELADPLNLGFRIGWYCQQESHRDQRGYDLANQAHNATSCTALSTSAGSLLGMPQHAASIELPRQTARSLLQQTRRLSLFLCGSFRVSDEDAGNTKRFGEPFLDTRSIAELGEIEPAIPFALGDDEGPPAVEIDRLPIDLGPP